MGHYLATWALSCRLPQRRLNNAVQNLNTATSALSTGEACNTAVEAYTASPPPPNRHVSTCGPLAGPQVLALDPLGALHVP